MKHGPNVPSMWKFPTKKHGFELGGVKDIRGKGFIICGNSPWLKSPLMEIDST